MSQRTARAKRAEEKASGIIKRKQYFKPLLVPIKSGKTDPETGEEETVETYIPRRQRRKIMRHMITSLRKGRISIEDIMGKQK